MQKLKYETTIQASKQVVWNTIVDSEKYEQWSKAFSANSQFIGKWEQGAELKFFDPNMGGTLANLETFKPHELICATHTATLTKDLVPETTGPMTEKWVGTKEVYKLSEKDGVSTLTIEIDTHADFCEMFNKAWPTAIKRIKELSEDND